MLQGNQDKLYVVFALAITHRTGSHTMLQSHTGTLILNDKYGKFGYLVWGSLGDHLVSAGLQLTGLKQDLRLAFILEDCF